MNLEDYRKVFVTGSLVLSLIVTVPTLGMMVSLPSGVDEGFSELWILGPNHKAEDYPFNVHANEPYSVFIGLGNHMGVSSYYLVYVKLRNQTQPIPNTTSAEPSPLAPLYEFRAFVTDGGMWEAQLAFKILNASFYGDSMIVNRIMINDETLDAHTLATWDSENGGFYFQLLLELWSCNIESKSFQFDNRFVTMWLNVTAT